MYLERQYFHDMLMFIQAKLNNYYNDTVLGLGLDSSKEVFDIMIVPCELVDTSIIPPDIENNPGMGKE